MLKTNINFSEIHLVPRVISEIESRNDIKTEVEFNKKLTLTCPFVTSPMKDVCDSSVAIKMSQLGGLGILHRFCSIDDNINEFKRTTEYGISACSIGINGDYLDRFKNLYEVGCRIFCLDVANGASLGVFKAIEKLENYNIDLIVGNVASKECYSFLTQFPTVRAIRVGIAGGSACSTRNATGIYHPMASCIAECAPHKRNTLLIADGGIKEPSDVCKAIALGADLIMMGSTIANTTDSPAELIKRDGKMYKIYHGSASFEIQKQYKERPKYIEGKTKLLEYEGENLKDLIDRFSEGLRSSMSYFNSRTLEEYKNNVNFCC